MTGWLGRTLAMGGLMALTMGLTMLYKTSAFYRYSAITTGKIVGTEYLTYGTRRSGHAAVVEFVLGDKKKKTDQKIRITATELKSEKEHKIGAEISVRYIPQKPEIGRINSIMEIWSEPCTALICGIAFMSVGLFFLQ